MGPHDVVVEKKQASTSLFHEICQLLPHLLGSTHSQYHYGKGVLFSAAYNSYAHRQSCIIHVGGRMFDSLPNQNQFVLIPASI